MTTPASLLPHLRLARLRAEAAVVSRLNAGFGFDNARTAARTYLRDPEARARMGRDALQPEDTHLAQAQELDAAIDEVCSQLELHDSPLTRVRDRFGLSEAETSLLSLAVAYELDPDSRALCDAAAGRSRAGLMAETACEIEPAIDDDATLLAILHPGAVLRRELLLEVADEGSGALASRTVSASRRLLSVLLGDPRLPADVAGQLTMIAPAAELGVLLSEQLLGRIDEVATLLRAYQPGSGEPAPMVLIQGPQGAGKRAVAHLLGRALGQPLAAADVSRLAATIKRGDGSVTRRVLAEARLRDALPYFAGIQAIETEAALESKGALVDALAATDTIVALSTREQRMASAPTERPFHLIRLPTPSLQDRRAAWSHGLAGLGGLTKLTDDAADNLATSYVVGPGTIGGVLREARAFARASGETIGQTAIEEAVARRLSVRLGSFGQLINRRASFAQMVISEEVENTLRDMISMVHQRSKILETWGYGKHLGISRGVSALFSGEPGTGKTMAASVISSELGMELIRIDLSAVVSKWVGETEKHLSKIFDEAQNANAMLVFDEADSLFGKRTQVKSAQDRYANLEVNYVLQRMETFDGICVLTSNLEASIDPAFLRRLNFRVRFPKPDVDERRQLWQRLLPPEVDIPRDLDLFEKLARTFDMAGGHIKNAIVRAAVIATRHGRTLEPADLVAGAHVEYLELGKVMPAMPSI